MAGKSAIKRWVRYALSENGAWSAPFSNWEEAIADFRSRTTVTETTDVTLYLKTVTVTESEFQEEMTVRVWGRK